MKGTHKSQWSDDEDTLLISLVNEHGQKQWSTIASHFSNRKPKQCRERYLNHLDPSIKTEWWSAEEDLFIIEYHERNGNKWSDMAAKLPGRPANSIKNHWNSTLKRTVAKVKKQVMESGHYEVQLSPCPRRGESKGKKRADGVVIRVWLNADKLDIGSGGRKNKQGGVNRKATSSSNGKRRNSRRQSPDENDDDDEEFSIISDSSAVQTPLSPEDHTLKQPPSGPTTRARRNGSTTSNSSNKRKRDSPQHDTNFELVSSVHWEKRHQDSCLTPASGANDSFTSVDDAPFHEPPSKRSRTDSVSLMPHDDNMDEDMDSLNESLQDEDSQEHFGATPKKIIKSSENIAGAMRPSTLLLGENLNTAPRRLQLAQLRLNTSNLVKDSNQLNSATQSTPKFVPFMDKSSHIQAHGTSPEDEGSAQGQHGRHFTSMVNINSGATNTKAAPLQTLTTPKRIPLVTPNITLPSPASRASGYRISESLLQKQREEYLRIISSEESFSVWMSATAELQRVQRDLVGAPTQHTGDFAGDFPHLSVF
mmetsp:Transcript_10825/g.40438  ORF Transcript_10825/g.40438 Transcript_10825/m.40438 type:complete len:535 (-) Transcript_10825:134-1738(-)|eukprot:CAMPEP_0117442548 /NCGR_PEP_ID=MMETSP0759-20121206/4210_1 /TAXON_ID=63605 /ORGANISM="Percolomonas cosmopolitus, Strain WS" /LENGTH=534 /DNA_ID=CAMNT_0005234443 /DNA_START=196 /DNA_END=1800 /DNA_ORIENTATION=-